MLFIANVRTPLTKKLEKNIINSAVMKDTNYILSEL